MTPTPLFASLQPPAGGLERLRRSIAAREAVGERWWLPAASAVVLAMVIAPLLQAERDDRAFRQAIVDLADRQASVQHPPELASGRDDVRIFLVVSQRSADRQPSAEAPR